MSKALSKQTSSAVNKSAPPPSEPFPTLNTGAVHAVNSRAGTAFSVDAQKPTHLNASLWYKTQYGTHFRLVKTGRIVCVKSPQVTHTRAKD